MDGDPAIAPHSGARRAGVFSPDPPARCRGSGAGHAPAANAGSWVNFIRFPRCLQMVFPSTVPFRPRGPPLLSVTQAAPNQAKAVPAYTRRPLFETRGREQRRWAVFRRFRRRTKRTESLFVQMPPRNKHVSFAQTHKKCYEVLVNFKPQKLLKLFEYCAISKISNKSKNKSKTFVSYYYS